MFRKQANYGAGMAFDDDYSTRWATDTGTRAAWLAVDLGKPRTIGRVRIHEPAQYKRVRAFELQYLDGEVWRTFYRGETIGPDWSTTVRPLTARRVRLNILEATEGPTLSEFQLLAPEK